MHSYVRLAGDKQGRTQCEESAQPSTVCGFHGHAYSNITPASIDHRTNAPAKICSRFKIAKGNA
jgi:hypothetical protein